MKMTDITENIKYDLICATKSIPNIKAVEVAIKLGFMNEDLLKLTKINCMIPPNLKGFLKDSSKNNSQNKDGKLLNPIEAMELFIKLAETLFLQIKTDNFQFLLSNIELKVDNGKTNVTLAETI